MAKRRLLTLYAAATLVASIIAAGDENLSDFYNDLFTDLGPFLSLFGESMTKQYLSESITWCDYIIFAMGPIGILTTVISAIRVCGYSWLKAFVGRSQEGVATVEAELCTSTSRDVCELHNHGGVVRIIGRPKLLELIHVPPHHRCKGKGPEQEIQLFRSYVQATPKTLDDAIQWKPVQSFSLSSWFKGRWSWCLGAQRVQKPKKNPGDDVEAGEDQDEVPDKPKNHGNATTENYRLAPASLNPPNLSLNIGIIELSNGAFYAIAALGLFLQGGIVVIAGIDAWALRWTFQSTGNPINKDAPFLFVIGTMLMCVGTMACAALIGQTTREVRYRREKESRSRLIYLQPHQVIGDQSINPFAFFETKEKPIETWTCSKKHEIEESDSMKVNGEKLRREGSSTNTHTMRSETFWKRSKGTAPKFSDSGKRRLTERFEFLSLVSVVAVLAGYILQFTGLRRMQTWVSFAQLGTTILMSILRGMLRMQRLAENDNLLHSGRSLAVGHELDWLAFEIWRKVPEESTIQDDSNQRAFSETLKKIEGWWTSKFSKKEPLTQDQPASSEEKCGPSYYEDLANPTSYRQLISIRQRLAHLTGNIPAPGYMGKEEYQDWDDNYIKVRTKAKALSDAICTVADSFIIEKSWNLVDIPLQIPDILQQQLGWLKTPRTSIEVLLKKPDEVSATGWTTDAARLEALLGLAMWTMVSDHRLVQVGEESAAETIESVRILSLAENSREIKLWYGDVVSGSKSAPLKLKLGGQYGLFDLWQKPSTLSERDRRNESTGRNPMPPVDKWRGDEPVAKEAVRFCGWTAVTEYLKEKTKQPEDDVTGSIVDVEFVRTRSSLLDTCAHELFTALLAGLKTSLETSHLEHKLSISDPKFDRSGSGIRMKSPTVTNLVDIFVNAALGSAAEGLLCVVPALRSQFSTDKLELEILAGSTEFQELEKENVLKCNEDQVGRYSISPYLRSLCTALRFVHEGGSRNHRSNRDDFKKLRERWANSTSPYKSEIMGILEDYAAFLTEVDGENTSKEVIPDIPGLVTDLECGRPGTTLSYLATTVRSRSFERSEFSAEGFPLLITAARKRLVGTLCILLSMGVSSIQAEMDVVDNFLFLPCFKHDEHETCARLLINHGTLDSLSQRAIGELLNQGVKSGAEKIVNLLIDLRKVHYDGYIHATWYAADFKEEMERLRFKELLKRAVDNGVNPTAILGYLHFEGHTRVQLDLLLSLEEVRAKHGQALLSWALHAPRRGPLYESTIQKLVKCGVKPDQPLGTPDGNTALHVAVSNKTFLDILINTESEGLNLEVQNDAGQTPFCRAVCEGQHESATLLLQKGSLAETTSGQRPIDCATHNKDDQMIKLILGKDAKLSQGRTDPR